MENLIIVGKLGKAHGLQGEMKLVSYQGFEEDVEKAGWFIVNLANQMLPIFVERIRGMGFLIVKIEGFDSKESVKTLENKELYLKKDQLLYNVESYQEGEDTYYGFLKGFELYTSEEESLGFIERVEEYPQQEMAIVLVNGKETLIPLVPDFIEKIDKPLKKIWMHLPEGLLSL
jgi:16S rRNA processing protein RimM